MILATNALLKQSEQGLWLSSISGVPWSDSCHKGIDLNDPIYEFADTCRWQPRRSAHGFGGLSFGCAEKIDWKYEHEGSFFAHKDQRRPTSPELQYGVRPGGLN